MNQRITIVLIVGLIVAAGLGILAFSRQQQASTETNAASTARANAEATQGQANVEERDFLGTATVNAGANATAVAQGQAAATAAVVAELAQQNANTQGDAAAQAAANAIALGVTANVNATSAAAAQATAEALQHTAEAQATAAATLGSGATAEAGNMNATAAAAATMASEIDDSRATIEAQIEAIATAETNAQVEIATANATVNAASTAIAQANAEVTEAVMAIIDAQSQTGEVLSEAAPDTTIALLTQTDVLDHYRGYLAATLDSDEISLDGQPNTLAWRSLPGLYTDFAASTAIEWGEGSPDQYFCGMLLRQTGTENFYAVQLNPLGDVWLTTIVDGTPQRGPSGSFANIVRSQPGEHNHLMVLVVKDTLVIYVNGYQAGSVQDSSLASGQVSIYSGTGDSTTPAGCKFTDTWLWDLSDAPVPRAVFQPDIAPAQVVEALIGVGVGSDAGYLVTEQGAIPVEMDSANPIQGASITGNYTDFIVGTDIRWGDGALSDECGLYFHDEGGGGNVYVIWLDRVGNIYFTDYQNGTPQAPTRGDGRFINAEADSVNNVVIAAVDNVYTLYVNGYQAAVFRGDLHTEGGIGVLGNALSPRVGASCSFENIWLWDFNAQPTTTPRAASATPSPAVSPTRRVTITPTVTPTSTATGTPKR